MLRIHPAARRAATAKRLVRRAPPGYFAVGDTTAAPTADDRTNLISQLVAFNVMGVHPVSQAQATALVDNALGSVQNKVTPIVIAGVAASILAGILLARG